MDSALNYLFGAAAFVPHGYCLLWRSDLLAMHAVSDGLIALAYFSIPLAILLFLQRRKDFEYRRVAWLFIAFITLCGLTHTIGLITLWSPIYGLQGVVKVATAIASVVTALALWVFLPRIVNLPSPAELEAKDEALDAEKLRRRRFERDARFSDTLFQEAFVKAPIGKAILSVDGVFIETNAAFCELCGYDRAELVATSYSRLTTEAHLANDLKGLDRLIDGTRKYLSQEKEIAHSSGRTLPIRENISAIPASVDSNGYLVVQVLDLTAQKENERLMNNVRAELERGVAERTEALARANRDLHDFNHVLSHDLKAPLRGLRIILSEVREALAKEDRERAEQCFGLLEDRIARLSRMIADLLTYSRTGQTRTQPEEVDCATLIENIAKLINVPAGFSVESKGLPTILTQRVPIETVFRNLITNAIAHHDRDGGRIRVRGEVQNDLALFEVEDDGPGIPEDQRELAFGLFRKLSTNSGTDGTGLGLTLVKRVVQLNGGMIEIDDPGEGRGCVFRFTWPLAETQAEVVVPANSSSLPIPQAVRAV